MIWQTDRRWRFHVTAGDGATERALENLPFQQGAELLSKVVAGIGHAGFKVDLTQLYKTNLFDILQGRRAILAWAPRPANATEEKRLSTTRIVVPLAAWTFQIVGSARLASTEVKETPRKFLLSIDENEKQAWEDAVAILKYSQGQQFLEELVRAISVVGFKAEVSYLYWSDPSRLKQGRIKVFKTDALEVEPAVKIATASQTWNFTVNWVG